jgi:hypothetical protein
MTPYALRRQLVVFVFALVLCARSAAAVDITPYAWQFPLVSNATGANAVQMIQQLQEEVQKILNLGRLAPMRAYYGDIGTAEEYWLYTEPGRIITTLAWAYPYLTSSQRTSVRSYVAAELASSTHAPWAAARLQPTTGARRELHPLNRVTYTPYGFGATRPTVQTIYGLWLYGYRSGDWATIQTYWSSIKSMYSSRSSQGDIYGTMSAHVAMARLADKFGDSATRTTALNNLQAQLDAGVNFATIEGRISSKYFPEMYTARRSGGVYQGWMFLSLSPEIGRYLADNVASAALSRNSQGKAKFPMWWLRQAPYFVRWTGDESVGVPSEMMGMVMPVERWVVRASAATLRDYMRSGPACIGDVYWLEGLVQAIEATGTITWVDARTDQPVPPPPPTNGPTAPTNLRIVG